MRAMKGVQLSRYEVEVVKPLVFTAKLRDENLVVMVYLIPTAVYAEGDRVALVVSSPVVTVVTDKPRAGETCSPQKFQSREAVVPEIDVVSEGGTEIRVNGRKVKLNVKVTNVNVYPDLRDDFGNPCVSLGWIQLTTVE